MAEDELTRLVRTRDRLKNRSRLIRQTEREPATFWICCDCRRNPQEVTRSRISWRKKLVCPACGGKIIEVTE